jgi:hypothetical protein
MPSTAGSIRWRPPSFSWSALPPTARRLARHACAWRLGTPTRGSWRSRMRNTPRCWSLDRVAAARCGWRSLAASRVAWRRAPHGPWSSYRRVDHAGFRPASPSARRACCVEWTTHRKPSVRGVTPLIWPRGSACDSCSCTCTANARGRWSSRGPAHCLTTGRSPLSRIDALGATFSTGSRSCSSRRLRFR